MNGWPARSLLAVIATVGALVAVGMVGFSSPPSAAVASTAATSRVTTGPEAITVHVSGAVERPGLVAVPFEARIAEVVAAAGGASRDADLSAINLAAVVDDADHVHIPVVGSPGGAGSSAAVDGNTVRVNDATVADLQALPGVGPVLAQRIADHRDDHGPFREVEDLLDVPGIGEGKLAQLRDAVVVP